MLKKDITFEDLDGNPRTQTFEFNLSKAELNMMEASWPGGQGLEAYFTKILGDMNVPEIIKAFETIIKSSYGVRDADGITFIKKDENGRSLGERFVQTDAYSELFMELLEDENGDAFSDFVAGVLPSKISKKLEEDGVYTPKGRLRVVEDVQLPETDTKDTVVTGETVEKKVTDYSREQLLAMPDDEFDKVAGTDPTKWPVEVLQVAFQRKSSRKA